MGNPIVGRQGHMEGETYVADLVMVEVVDPSGFACIGSAPTEEEAAAAATDAIEQAKKELAEQMVARQKMQERLERLEALAEKLEREG
jgi:hypothetical protein